MAAAAGAVRAGIRLPRPLMPPKPSKNARTIMLMAWVAAIVAFLLCASIYVQQATADHLLHGAKPVNHIAPLTGLCVIAIFVAILTVARSRGWRVALASTAIGAMAAPMIFEFPFDLIVMGTYLSAGWPGPGVVPCALLRALGPGGIHDAGAAGAISDGAGVQGGLLLLRRHAADLRVLGLHEFGYPATAFPIAMNAVSKVVAFIAGLSLFLRQRAPVSTAVNETPATVPTSIPLSVP